jgi:hypothetical protein
MQMAMASRAGKQWFVGTASRQWAIETHPAAIIHRHFHGGVGVHPIISDDS